jgi:hypothetical protein
MRDYLGTIQQSRAEAWDSKVPKHLARWSLLLFGPAFFIWCEIVLGFADPLQWLLGEIFEKTCYKSRGFGLGSPYLEGLLLLQVAK